MNIIVDPTEAVSFLSQYNTVSIDIETTGLSPWRNNIALIQMMGSDPNTCCLIRIRDGQVPTILYELFTADRTFVGHNITAFDLLFIGTHGIPWERAQYYDTLTGECIISTTGRRDVSKSLKESVRRRLGIKIDKDIEHGNWTAETLSPSQEKYAVEDVAHLIDLMETQVNKAVESGQLNALKFEMNTIKPLVRMTLNGLPVDLGVLNTWLTDQEEIRNKNIDRLIEILGDINFNSPVQLKKACAAVGVPLSDTKAETLQELSTYGDGITKEIADLILGYRGPAQRLKMYSPSWQAKYITDGIVHPRFWSAGTDTLRTSSSDPNIQQVPADGRRVFGGVDGHRIVWCDYSQIEVRIAAEIARDTALIKSLKHDDVHTAIAAQVFGIDFKHVTPTQRRASKAMTFLLLFGGGASKLYQYIHGQGSDVTMEDVNKMFNDFFSSFAGLAAMRKRAYAMAKNRGVVSLQLPNGAKRVLVGMKKSPPVILNTLVQGTAAIGIKRALQLCHDRGLTKYIGATVHDEIVAAVPLNEVTEFKHELSKAMIDGMVDIMPGMHTKVEVKDDEYWGK